MDDAALAKWLREELPRIKRHAAEFPWKDASREDEAKLIEALTTLVALLREAEEELDTTYEASILAARLRTILGKQNE